MFRFAALLIPGMAIGCQRTEVVEPEAPCEPGFLLDADGETCLEQECGEGPWGGWDRSGGALHVAPWGTDDGDGSEDRPFASIQAASDHASGAGLDAIAIAEGTYLEDIRLIDDHDGLMLHGRCADRTVIQGVDPGGNAVWVRGQLSVRLRDLAIGGPRYGLAVEGGLGSAPEVHARRVAFRGAVATGVGVFGGGARVELDDCVVEDTTGGVAPAWGRGIEVLQGGRLTATGLTIRNVQHDGLLVGGSGSSADLRDTQVVGTRPHEADADCTGVQVWDGGALVADGLLIDDTVGAGLMVNAGGATAELRSSTIRGTRHSPEMPDGPGFVLLAGGTLTGVGLDVLDNEGSAAWAGGATARLSLTDSRIADTRPREDGVDGRGLSIVDGARLDATRLEVVANRFLGLQGAGLGTELHLVDCVVADQLPDDRGDGGIGVLVDDRATLYATGLDVHGNHQSGLVVQGGGTFGGSDVRLLQNHEISVQLHGEGTLAAIEDSRVEGGLPGVGGDDGLCVRVSGGARLEATRLDVGGCVRAGLIASDAGTTVHLVDTRVAGTRPAPDGLYGRGVGIQGGAALTVEGLVLERNHEIALVATGPGTSVVGSGVRALDTLPLASGQYGRGLGAGYGASLDLGEVEVRGSSEMGVWASGAGTTLTLRDAVIEDTLSTGGLSAGWGVGVDYGAEATLRSVRVAHNDGPGLWVNAEGVLTGEDVVLEANGFAGAVVYSSTLSLEGGGVSDAVAGPGRPGGVGILARAVLTPPALDLRGVRFSNHRYGGLYLRGPGRYAVRGCSFDESGHVGPETAGGVFATEGVEAWQEVEPAGVGWGLLIEDSTFSTLASDAIVLDQSSAEVSGAVFSDVGGDHLVWQRCEGTEPPVIDGVQDAICASAPRAVEPLLVLHVDTIEAVAAQ